MSVFLDTSAVLAVMDSDESSHRRCAAAWKNLITEATPLVTTSYVVVELFALLQRRLGMSAVRGFETSVMPLLNVIWIEGDLHQRAIAAMLTASRRKLSLVDCASFEVMRERGIKRAFTLDRHFTEQGFERVP